MARKLETQPARYGLRKTMLKTLAITEGKNFISDIIFQCFDIGRTEFNANLFTNEVPRRIIIGSKFIL